MGISSEQSPEQNYRDAIARRSFLGGAGLGAAALTAEGLARPGTAYGDVSRSTVTGRYALSNPFFEVSGAHGKISELAVDPKGEGDYEKAAFRPVIIGGTDIFTPTYNGDVTWTATENALRVSNISAPGAGESLSQRDRNAATEPLADGHTFGQSFTVKSEFFTRAGGQFPTYYSTKSGMTLTLYQGQPEGTLTFVASKDFRDFPDNSYLYLDFEPMPKGTYYLEMSEPIDTPAWWYLDGSATVDVGGNAYVDRTPREGRTMVIDIQGFSVIRDVSWEVNLEGKRLRFSYTIPSTGGRVTDPGLSMVTSWQKDGYSIDYDDGVLFSRFIGESGRYMPAHQLKRRDEWGQGILTSGWIYATGTGPYDLRLSSPSLHLYGTMTSSEMTLSLDGIGSSADDITRSLDIEAFRHSDWVPETYPVFVASDHRRAEQVSEFYYERAFSFPFGPTYSDWKEWMGRTLDWTGTEGRRAERISLLNIGQEEDGYVWSWFDGPSWPFPPGYDNRSDVTNSCYVLGAYRYFSWTGDAEFLKTMMPRLRKAVDYNLNQFDGKSGLITHNSPLNTGDYQAPASNYWDLVSYGNLDAHSNAYFYGSLAAAANLEEYVGNTARAEELRVLRELTREKYNELFWDEDAGRYIQCVDVNGRRHDYGATYVNLEAASFGLPSPQQAERIFEWLNEGHTELTDTLVLVPASAGVVGQPDDLRPEHTLGQSFTVDKPFSQVAASITGAENSTFVLTLYSGGPDGEQIASRTFFGWWRRGYASLSFPEEAAGTYYLELSEGSGAAVAWISGFAYSDGQAYSDGVPSTDKSRSLVVVSPYRQGPADIYSAYEAAPRSHTRRNDFWYMFLHDGPYTPWPGSNQDGGSILWISAYDVISRAAYVSSDDAWKRMSAILDRWSQPDHLCGGAPLYDKAEGDFGVDLPFPESGITPASFLYAFLGIDAEPTALTITPNLPSDLEYAGVKNLFWRGRKLDVMITRDTVTVHGQGLAVHKRYQQGETIRLPA